MKTELVKLSAKGKIIISLQGVLKQFFAHMVERLMQELEPLCNTSLDMSTVEYKKNFALVSEIYFIHFVQFNMLNGQPIKVRMTISQALCIWQLANDYEEIAFTDPAMGNLLMELHRKLS
jgi:hypothetical protein